MGQREREILTRNTTELGIGMETSYFIAILLLAFFDMFIYGAFVVFISSSLSALCMHTFVKLPI